MKTTITALLITLFLTGCGFHLRGEQPISDNKRSLQLHSLADPAGFNRYMVQALRNASISTSDEAPYQLRIINSRWTRSSVTLDRRAKVDEYALTLEVDYLLFKDSADEPMKTIRAQRIYSYDSGSAAASSEKEALLREEVYQSVAQQLLRRFLSTRD